MEERLLAAHSIQCRSLGLKQKAKKPTRFMVKCDSCVAVTEQNRQNTTLLVVLLG